MSRSANVIAITRTGWRPALTNSEGMGVKIDIHPIFGELAFQARPAGESDTETLYLDEVVGAGTLEYQQIMLGRVRTTPMPRFSRDPRRLDRFFKQPEPLLLPEVCP